MNYPDVNKNHIVGITTTVVGITTTVVGINSTDFTTKRTMLTTTDSSNVCDSKGITQRQPDLKSHQRI